MSLSAAGAEVSRPSHDPDRLLAGYRAARTQETLFDLRAGAVKAGNDADADCTIGIADSDLINLVEGTVNGPQLFMGGLIQIEGDMSLAMRLQSVLGG